MSATPISNIGQQKRSNEELVKDFKFFKDNYDELLAKYTNQWIAVLGEQVVASASDYVVMEAQLRAKGIAHNETIREYMTKEDQEEFVFSDVYDPDTGEWQLVITHFGGMRYGD